MDNYICLITIVVFYGKDGFQYWRLLRSLHMYVSVCGPDNRRLAVSDWRCKHQRPIGQLKHKYECVECPKCEAGVGIGMSFEIY